MGGGAANQVDPGPPSGVVVLAAREVGNDFAEALVFVLQNRDVLPPLGSAWIGACFGARKEISPFEYKPAPFLSRKLTPHDIFPISRMQSQLPNVVPAVARTPRSPFGGNSAKRGAEIRPVPGLPIKRLGKAVEQQLDFRICQTTTMVPRLVWRTPFVTAATPLRSRLGMDAALQPPVTEPRPQGNGFLGAPELPMSDFRLPDYQLTRAVY